MFSKDIENKYRDIIKSTLAPLEAHKVSVEAMLLKIGEQFYGYTPFDVYPKKPLKGDLSEIRQKEFANEFNRIACELAKQDIEVLLCFMRPKEGGTMLYFTESAINHKIDYTDVFQEMRTRIKR